MKSTLPSHVQNRCFPRQCCVVCKGVLSSSVSALFLEFCLLSVKFQVDIAGAHFEVCEVFLQQGCVVYGVYGSEELRVISEGRDS